MTKCDGPPSVCSCPVCTQAREYRDALEAIALLERHSPAVLIAKNALDMAVEVPLKDLERQRRRAVIDRAAALVNGCCGFLRRKNDKGRPRRTAPH